MKLNEGFIARMQDAVKVLQSRGPMAATQAIQSALRGGTPPPSAAPQRNMSFSQPSTAPLRKKRALSESMQDITDISLNEVDEPAPPSATSTGQAEAPASNARLDTGQFLSGSCSNHAGTRAYKLYIPSGYSGQPLPLVVMLHGCKQNPDDFAVGTGMNQHAEENNCFVVYPAQAANANGSNCWNWFLARDQQRGDGEPSIIADITREVISKYGIDEKRCYVAGLSAGGAMAAIMSAAYPDIYAAAGVHSGLPAGAATNVQAAFAAMKSGSKTFRARPDATPIIVFHGDRDATVHPCNGKHAIEQSAGGRQGGSGAPRDATVVVNKGRTAHGRAYTTTIRRAADGRASSEHWVIHEAGHAWSGGSSKGSYTDPSGPDASREMLRFFLEHPLP